jgi:hypothetical protein
MTEHWIKDWSWNPANETSRAAAEAHEQYGHVWLRDDGSVDRTECYRRGSLFVVEYYDGRSDEETSAFHALHYPAVGRKEIRECARAGAYTWTRFRFVEANGAVKHRARWLRDERGRDIMTIDRGDAGKVTGITKYFWPDPDTLRFAFEYDPDGKRSSVWDLVENAHGDFDYLVDTLPDVPFYADGWTLPAPIAGTPIPDACD